MRETVRVMDEIQSILYQQMQIISNKSQAILKHCFSFPSLPCGIEESLSCLITNSREELPTGFIRANKLHSIACRVRNTREIKLACTNL